MRIFLAVKPQAWEGLLRLLVDEIKLYGNELVVRGSHRWLAGAIGFMQKKKLGGSGQLRE